MIIVDVLTPVWSQLASDDLGHIQEVRDYFTFEVASAKYDKRVKAKLWDGKICLIRSGNKLYTGLIPLLRKFCDKNSIGIQVNDPTGNGEPATVDRDRMLTVIKDVVAHFGHKPRDYQLESALHCVKTKRATVISPTASGKSLIIHIINDYLKKPTLLVVPTQNLVLQMRGDMISYGLPPGQIQIIMEGETKDVFAPLVISTWQSIAKLPRDWFARFEVVICDEVHRASAKSLTRIVEMCSNAIYRIGLTGSLDNIIQNILTIVGLFGSVHRAVTTKELTDRGDLAKLSIKMVRFNYAPSDRKELDTRRKRLLKQQKKTAKETGKRSPSAVYNDEIDFLITHPLRREKIVDQVKKLKGNTMVLFHLIDKDGVPMVDALKAAMPDTLIHFVWGGTKAQDREQVRDLLERNDGIVVVASDGVFSTGVNIKNLNNVVCIAPTKSLVKVMQSIGRALRLGENKTTAIWIDIVDDLSFGKHINYAGKHAGARLKIYKDEKHEVEFEQVNVW